MTSQDQSKCFGVKLRLVVIFDQDIHTWCITETHQIGSPSER